MRIKDDTSELLFLGGAGLGCCLFYLLGFVAIVFTIAAAIRWVIR